MPELALTRKKRSLADSLRAVEDKTLGKWLAATGIHPNAVTIIGMVLCLSASGIWTQQYSWGPAFWVSVPVFLVGALLDGLDGSVARVADKASPFGKHLDSILDRVVDNSVYFGLGWVLLFHGHHYAATLACIVAAGSTALPSYIRLRAEIDGLKMSGGFGDRLGRLLLLMVIIPAGHWFPVFYQIGVYAVIGSSLWTAGRRLRILFVNRHNLKSAQAQ